jgi:hypothetical protein
MRSTIAAMQALEWKPFSLALSINVYGTAAAIAAGEPESPGSP